MLRAPALAPAGRSRSPDAGIRAEPGRYTRRVDFINRLEIDVYKSRIESLDVLANLYKTQVDAVKGRVDLEKLGLEVYQLQVQTYSAMVQAKNASSLVAKTLT